MAQENNLKIDGLEFNDIRTNLKNYLKGQSEFLDYDFDASGMGALLDLLSYNTYHNMFYTTMAANESFIETAQKRSSVVKQAASMGYTPRSTRSSKLTGTINLTPSGSPVSLTIPYGTTFESTVDGVTYKFVNEESLTINSNGGVFSGTLVLTQGTTVTEEYTYNPTTNPESKFRLNNQNIDTSTISIVVQNSISDGTLQTYTLADNVVELLNTSQVYYLSEIEDGYYQIRFGDGILSQSLSTGNIVRITYIVSKGVLGNGLYNMSLASTIDGVSSATFVANEASFGGQDPETIDSIKFNAPRAYTSQNRAITAEDYEYILKKQSNVSSVLVWGGEDNDPPAYGKVFVAIRPTIGDVLTSAEKKIITDSVLKPKIPLTVSAEIVDPEYLFLIISVDSIYNPEQTIKTQTNLKTQISNVISKYNTDNLNQFSRYFRYSELSRLIDFSDRSILSTDMTVRMKKKFDVQLNSSARYVINFSNSINNTTEGRPTSHPYGVGNQVTSTPFSYGGYDNCLLEDNGGFMRIYTVTSTGSTIGVSQNIGTIDYTSGQIILDNFAPTAIAAGGINLNLTAVPSEKNILPLRGQIVVIDDSDVTVAVTNDKTISLTRR